MRHVLMIEEDPEVQKLVAHALEGRVRLSISESEEDCSRFLSEEQPELILLSAEVKGPDGTELFRRFRTLPDISCIPVLLLIRKDEPALEEKACSLGYADLITVPCSEAVIWNRVNTQLELRSYRTNALEDTEYQDTISVSIAELVECRDITTGGH